MSAVDNILHLRFGRLTVVEFVGVEKHKARWRCVCDCGREATVRAGNLRNGSIISCGCAKADRARTLRLAHGDKRTKLGTVAPEWKAWDSMIQRCENPNNPSYSRYGGRGISVCHQWRRSYSVFLADVGRRPSSEHSLDRYPNKDGNYEPRNVRWATAKQQANNRNPPRKAHAA